MMTIRSSRHGASGRWLAVALTVAGVAFSLNGALSTRAACGDLCSSLPDADPVCAACEVTVERSCTYCDPGPGEISLATVDSDGDGLADGDEARYGADPANPDSDNDGLPDGAEIHDYGTYPWTHDSDSDNVSDYRELFESFTNPLSPDSDGDGYSDSAELYSYATDPNDPGSYPAAQGQR